MPLIDQQEAIKKIRNNREYLADTDYIRGLNAGIEYSVDAVEQMKGQEIIRCHECKHNPLKEWFGCPMAHLNSRQRPEDAWCWKGERRGNSDGNTDS